MSLQHDQSAVRSHTGGSMKTAFAFVVIAIVIGSLSVANRSGAASESQDSTAIRPFHFKAPQAALDDLKKRVQATRWPEKETVSDQSQGVQLATMKALAAY